MNAPLAVLRFPRTPAQAKGRDVVTTAAGVVVMVCDATSRGRQVDVTAASGEPVGRILETGRGRWQLLAPGTLAVLATADLRHGGGVAIAAGPPATFQGRGEEWDLRWQRTDLLAARKTPRKVAKRSLDVYVLDAACTPVVVAFVVHVRRWWVAQQGTETALIVAATTTPVLPSSPPS